MLLNVTCRQGRLQLTDDGYLQVVSFNRPVWRIAVQDISAFEYQPGIMQSVTLTVHALQEAHTAHMVIRKEFDRLCELLPGITATELTKPEKPAKAVAPPPPVSAPPAEKPIKPRRPTHWWEDETRLTHIATYTSEMLMRMDVEHAYQHGWQIQGQQGQQGQISGAKVIGGAILAGPVGAMLGAMRSKGRTTITFVRSPEWMAAHPK